MFGNSDKIRCCGNHTDYPTPVIPTFKFRGKEWWCPHCGAKYEFFDGFKYFHKNEDLENRGRLFEGISLEYLSCSAVELGIPEQAKTYVLGQKPDL